ncbi:hypothetical protein G9A89_015169 [Geosiphon pyriformis]|nr:hypothetical protein G9A89_015169 [Geosiphon pyriformis]
MEATVSSTTPKKKASKGAFYVVLGNVKHSGNERNISLSKSGSSGSVYSNVECLSGEDEDVSMSGTNDGSLLGSAATTPKTKQINTGVGFGSPFGSSNFHMDDDKVVLSSRLPIFLEKKWIDPKIIKTPVEVLIRKLFVLDINLLAVEDKSAMAKTQLIRKIFSTVNEKSMEMTTSLAREKGINVNSDLKKQGMRSDWAVVIKKISMDMPKDIIVTTISEFGEIKLIKIQLMGMWQKASFLIGKNSVHITKAVGNCETWTSKDWFRVLLFTLLVGITAHDLGTFLEKTSEKTCVINRSLEIGNRICCAVVGFESDNDLESAFYTEPILGGVRLSWTRINLVQCERCGMFGYSVLKCDAPVATTFKPLKKPFIRVKKSVPISHPAAFGGRSWAQVVLLAGSSDSFHFASGSSSSLSGILGLNNSISLISVNNSSLDACLASLEQFLELLTDQVSGIMRKLSNMELDLVVDMVINDSELVLSSLSSTSSSILILSLNSLKVLTTKVGCLESKLVALEAFIGSVLAKLKLICAGSSLLITTCNIQSINIPAKQDIVYWHKKSGNMIANKFDEIKIFLIGLDKGFLGAGVAIIMDNNLACHVCKIEEILDWVILMRLLFKGKLSVLILGLYVTPEINVFIAKAVNSSTFLVIDGDFNENGSRRSVCFKFCSDLGLVNSLNRSSLVKASIWSNSRGVEKTINFVFVSVSLASTVTRRAVSSASEFFKSDHKMVSVSVDLDGLMDVNLNGLQCFSSEFQLRSVDFDVAKKDGNLDKILHWNLVANHFVDTWSVVDFEEASIFHAIIDNGAGYNAILGHLSSVRKSYHRSKYFKSKNTKDAAIRKAVNKHMENFCTDKGHMIKNILEWPFRKVVLDHLIVENDLVLEPNEVKSTVDTIMEGWTRKHTISDVLPACWTAQYAPLSYVDDNVFSKVMCNIGSDEFLQVVKCLLDGKAGGLLDSKFFTKSGKADSRGGLTSFLAAGTFVDDTIWIGNSMTITQNILNIAMACTSLGALFADRKDWIPEVGFLVDIHLCNFGFANSCLVENRPGIVSVYTDGSVKNLGSAGTCGSVTAYFSDVDLSIRVRVYGLLSLTLMELQTITFALKCILTFSSVMLFTDSQTSLDMCALLVNSVGPDFHNKCWIKKEHIHITIASKGLSVCWNKVKGHSGVVGNKHADFFADTATKSNLYMTLAKGFMLKEWMADTVHLLGPGSDGGLLVINLVCEFAEGHQSSIWILTAKLRMYYEKHGLLPRDSFVCSDHIWSGICVVS